MPKPVEEFVQTASEVCSLIENHEHYLWDDFFRRAEQLLPLLYYRATRLPDLHGQPREEPLTHITHEEWKALFDRLGAYLQERNHYWLIDEMDIVFIDAEEPKAPKAMVSCLSDDFADIWRALKNGLMHWNGASGDVRNDIVHHWRFFFYGHWSDHVLHALRVVNYYCQEIERNE